MSQPPAPDDAADPSSADPSSADPSSADPPTVSTRPRGRNWRAAALIGVLVALLGFAIAVQVKSHSSADSLAGAREDDLIRILDDQNSRADRLTQQIDGLSAIEAQLKAGGDRDAVARAQAEKQQQDLAVLLGTVAATGPGVRVEVLDPQRGLKAADLLDLIEELRGAGAEAIQFGSVRVGVSTNLVDAAAGSVVIDGVTLTAPYQVLAIGDPATLQTALAIPGGPSAVARSVGGDAVVSQQSALTITAVRTVPNPKYAVPGR